MIRTILVVGCAVTLAFAELSIAEIVQIPVPELVGPYPASREVTIRLRDEPLTIRGAYIHLVGEATVGLVICGSGGPSYPIGLSFDASLPDTPRGIWYAIEETPDQSGSFEITTWFQAYRDPTWEFLMDGEAELTFIGGTGFLPGGCWENPPPEATVSEAVLYVDADFPVPTETTTWGRIKALYE